MARDETQNYQDHIQGIIDQKDLSPAILLNENRVGFSRRGIDYYVEAKKSDPINFGKKKIIWTRFGGWNWKDQDEITDLLDGFGVLSRIKNFQPKKFTERNDANYKKEFREYDQKNFHSAPIEVTNAGALYKYYAKKDIYYVQIEEVGFYYLERDKAFLDPTIPQFRPQIVAMLRTKLDHSLPYHAYWFYAELIVNPNPILKSRYDLEMKAGRMFPPL